MKTNFEKQMERLEKICLEKGLIFNNMKKMVDSQRSRKLRGNIASHKTTLKRIIDKTLEK